MRILLITDTHGELEIINHLLETEQADLCIHCGDFGFYDHDSLHHLTQRELQLRIRHSDLPKKIRKKSYSMQIDQARDVIREHGLLAGFQPYLDGEKRFQAPVYAVSGNHEDHKLVEALSQQQVQVPNLLLLDEQQHVMLSEHVALVGLGGNFYLEGDGLFAPGLTGAGGKVRASWLQVATLMENLAEPTAQQKEKEAPEHTGQDITTIFVSHVSPGKSEARLLERMCLVMGINLVVSGHMDPPLCHAYSLFTMCEPDEVIARSQPAYQQLCERWAAEREDTNLNEAQQALIERSLQRLDIPDLPPPQRGRRASPGSVEHFYYNTQFLNLADAPEGWSVLEIKEDFATLQTRSRWSLRRT